MSTAPTETTRTAPAVPTAPARHAVFGRRTAAGGAAALLALAARGTGRAARAPTPTPTPGSLRVGPVWLAERMSDPNLRVVDVRAREQYDAGHIPNALHLYVLDLDTADERKVSNLKPEAEVAQLLGALGIGDDQQLIVYDSARTTWAARVFWALDYLGHPATAILDGGWPRWVADGGSVAREAPRVAAAKFAPAVDAAKLAGRDDVLARIGAPGTVIVDSRPIESWRAGHVPGAVSVPWDLALASDASDALLKDPAAIAEIYEVAGVTPDKEIVIYCGAGVVSAQAYFVLRLLGYPQVRLYDSSWQEWGQDPGLPVDKA